MNKKSKLKQKKIVNNSVYFLNIAAKYNNYNN